MEDIVSKCVRLTNLPPGCTTSMLVAILDMAPGENLQLQEKIDKLHNVDANTWLILFNTTVDAEQCLNKDATNWIFETSNGAFYISPSRACLQDVPNEWTNSPENIMLRKELTVTVTTATGRPSSWSREDVRVPSRCSSPQPMIFIIHQQDNDADYQNLVQQALHITQPDSRGVSITSPEQSKHSKRDDCVYVESECIEQPEVKTTEDHIYMELVATEIDEKTETSSVKRPIPSPRRSAMKAKECLTDSHTEETPIPPVRSKTFEQRRSQLPETELIRNGSESLNDWPSQPPALPPRPRSLRKSPPPVISGILSNDEVLFGNRRDKHHHHMLDMCDSSHVDSRLESERYSWTMDSFDRQIIVAGTPDDMNTYEILDYFKKRNIISDIEILDVSYRPIEKETLFLCQNNEVAEQIINAINKGVQIEGSTLTALLHKDYPYDTHKILITGLPEKETVDEISHEMKMLMSQKPTHVFVAQSYTSALICVDTAIDMIQIESLNEKCSERGYSFKLSPVKKSRSIKVACSGHSVSVNAIREYFEHKVSEDENITDVIHRKDENEFMISFKGYCDAELFSRQEVHTIEGCDVHVSMYYPCLEVQVTMPRPFLYQISPFIRRFLQRSDHYKKDSMDILGSNRGNILWPPLNDSVDCIEISCTMAYTEATDNDSISKWEQGCRRALNDICKRLHIITVYSSKQVWTQVESQIKKMELSDATYVERLDKDYAVVVSGEVSKVKKVAKRIQDTVDSAEAKQESLRLTKKQRLKEYELDILKMLETFNKFPKSLTVTERDSCLIFDGTNDDIKTAMNIVASSLNSCDFQIIHDECDLSRKLFRCGEAKEYIYQNLRDEHIACVFADIRRQVHVFGRSDDEAKKAVAAAKRLLYGKIFYLDKRTRDFFADKEGETFFTKLEQKYMGLMMYNVCAKRIEVLCVYKVYERVCDAIALTIDMQSEFDVFLHVEPGTLAWIDRHCPTSVSSIIKRYGTLPNPLTITKCDTTEKSGFYINGIKGQCRKASLSLIEIRDSIMRKDHIVMWSDVYKFLSSADGVNDLTECENTSKCVIRYSKQKFNTSGRTMPAVAVSKLQDCSIELTTIDLTDIKADYLVNPTSSTFDFSSELSQQILCKGGNSIQVECEKVAVPTGRMIVTASGQLPCKGILHAVLDKLSTDSPENEKALRTLIVNCMTKADTLQSKSIAFPVICGGQFGVPIDVCGKIMLSSIKHFWLECGLETSVKNVYICDADEELLKRLADNLKDYFQNTTISPEINDACRTDNANNGGGIRVEIIKGNIVLQEADAIVNPTNERLDLRVGAVSRQLTKTGGSSIQEECSKRYKNGISVREIATTTGGSLKCKELFHGVLEQWDEGKGYSEMVLRHFVSTCLLRAHTKGYTSIAFPALGSGMLGFPAEVVAKAMFEEVKKFGHENPESRLVLVRLVILPGSTLIIQAFEEYQNKLANSNRHSTVPVHSFCVNNENDIACTIGPVTLYVQQGDITAVQTTAFVNVTSETLQLDVGNISKMVLAAAGVCIQHEAEDNMKEFKSKGLTVTSAGRLLHRKIIHVKGKSTINGVKKAVRNCLIEADKLRLTSLAFPLIGTGCKGISTEKIVRAMVETFSEYILGHEYKSYLKTVKLVVYKKPDLDVVISEVTKCTDPCKRQSAAFKFRDTDEFDGKQKLTFHIHGDNVSKAVDFLCNMEIHESICFPKLAKHHALFKRKIDDLKSIGERLGVRIKTSKDRVTVIGLGTAARVLLEKVRQEKDIIERK